MKEHTFFILQLLNETNFPPPTQAEDEVSYMNAESMRKTSDEVTVYHFDHNVLY